MRIDRATRLPGIVTAALLAAGCAGAPRVVEPPPAASDPRSAITELALSMVGVPYRYGGADPGTGFDCSGLVYYSYTKNGHVVPRTAMAQFDASARITLEQAAKGDLLFFTDQEKLSHVGIFLGEGQFIHAPSSGGAVRVANVDAPYYRRHLVAVGRLLP